MSDHAPRDAAQPSVLWTLAAPHMPDILDRLYARIQGNKRLAARFPSREAMDAEEVFRLEHWQGLFGQVESKERKAVARTVGERHRAAGLGPGDVFESYAFVMDALLMELATEQARKAPRHENAVMRLAVVQRALVLSAMMDMASYLGAYGAPGALAGDERARLRAEVRAELREEIEAEMGGRFAAMVARRTAELETEIEADLDEKVGHKVQAEVGAKVDTLASGIESDAAKAVNTVVVFTEDLNAAVRNLESIYQEVEQDTGAVAAAAQTALGTARAVTEAALRMDGAIAQVSQRVTGSMEAVRTADASASAVTVAVARLVELADDIDDIATEINGALKRTKLLALNATIEAMRGDGGDGSAGFAESASAVKAMADESARSVVEIGERLTAIRDVAENMKGAIGGVAGSVGRVCQINATIADAVEQQAAVSRELAGAAETVAEAAERVAALLGGVRARTGAAKDFVTRLEGGADTVMEAMWDLPRTLAAAVRAVGGTPPAALEAAVARG